MQPLRWILRLYTSGTSSRTWDFLNLQAPDTPVYEVNTACIEWGNHVIGGRERAKHIDLRKHFAHETIQNRMMCLIKIDTSKQLADIFTKPLAYAQFIGCVHGILGDPDAMRQAKVHALQARLSAGPGDSGGGVHLARN